MPYEVEPNLNLKVAAETYVTTDKPLGTIVNEDLHRFYLYHSRQMWSLEELSIKLSSSDFDPTLAKKAEMDSLIATTLVESGNPIFSPVLMNFFRRNHQHTGFLAIWTYEEWKHYAGSLMYLEAMAQLRPELVDILKLDRDLKLSRDGEWGRKPSQYSPLLAAAYPMMQELYTHIAYRSSSQIVEEPVLRWLYGKMAGDEMRHHVYYYDRTKEELQDPNDSDKLDPNALAEFDQFILDFHMPGDTFVPDYEVHAAAIENVVQVGIRDYELVIGKVEKLVGKEHVAEVLSDKDYRIALSQNQPISPAAIDIYRAKLDLELKAAGARRFFAKVGFGR